MDIANWIASKQAHAMSKKSSDKCSLNPAMSEALLVLDFGINMKYHID
jgi:hypothetical protein